MKSINKLLSLSLAAVVGFASYTFADDAGTGGKKKSLESRIAELEAKLKDAGVGGGVKGSGIKISGYVDTSYLINLADNDGAAGALGGAAPGVSGGDNANVGRVFDTQKNSVNLNAVKLTIEKSKDSSKYPAGFRVDTIYGTDAAVLNGARAFSAQNSENTFSLEQAYINLGIPLGNGVDAKFGKMVSLLGYEVIESPANWQFSRSDAFRLQPLTQEGLTLGYQWSDYITSTIGVINGFDNSALASTTAAGVSGAGNLNTDFSFVGRLDLIGPKTSFGDWSGYVAGLYGNDNIIAAGVTDNSANISVVDVGVNWTHPFAVKNWNMGLEFLERVDSGITTGAALAASSSASADSLSVYNAWTWNKWLTTSARYSNTWYEQGTSTALVANHLLPFATGAVPWPHNVEVSSLTLTQAFNVWKDTLVRLEWRHDWTTLNPGFGGSGPVTGFGAAAGGADARETADTVAVNLVYSF